MGKIILFILTIFSLDALAATKQGQLISVLNCKERWGVGCVKQKVSKSEFCVVDVTTLSPGEIGNSEFLGSLTISGIKIKNKKFSSSIAVYEPDNRVGGLANFSFEWNGLDSSGEWNGLSKKEKNGMLKISIKNFYYHLHNSDGKSYTEYHCRF